MLTGKTTVLVSDKAAADLHNVLIEASEWIQNVTGKNVDASNFRSELENGIILCELIEKIKPGSIRRINRMNIAMAHLDNLKQFLNACEKFGLKDSQLFDVTDLQVQSTLRLKSGGIKHTTADRRLRNVCITIYWLGRKLAYTPGYKGPQLNLEAFKEILDIPSNPSSIYLQGYDTPGTPPTNNKTSKPPNIITSSKPPTSITSKCVVDVEPVTPPPIHKLEIKNVDKKPQTVSPPPPDSPIVNGGMSPDENISADDLLLSIENAVNELLSSNTPSEMKPQPITPTELLQRNERSYSSPSPTSMSTPSPIAQPLPLFLDIKIVCVPGVSLGLQLVGGADTAIPAQVEVVMPGKPAEASGLKAGDIIISIEGQDVTRMAHYQLIEFIKQSVSKGSLLLGVERSVVEVPRQKTSSTITREEHAERLRQQKEIAEMYGSKARSYSYSSGEEHHMVSRKMGTHEEEQEVTLERPVSSNGGSSSVEEEFDIEIDDNLQWELPTALTADPPDTGKQEQDKTTTTMDEPSALEETMESTVSRLQEELEALTSMVTPYKSPSPDPPSPPPMSTTANTTNIFDKSTGIGQIMSSTVKSVTIEPEQLMYSENIHYDVENEEIDESSSEEGDVSDMSRSGDHLHSSSAISEDSGTRNINTDYLGNKTTEDKATTTSTPTSTEPINITLHQKEQWKTYRQEADGREEKVTITPPPDLTPAPHNPTPTHDDDPFAPIVMKPSTSSHLLSDVLSVDKTTNFKSNPKPSMKSNNSYNKPSTATSHHSSYQATPTQSFSSNPRQYTIVAQSNTKRSNMSPPQAKTAQTTDFNKADTHKQPSFETQDEIQEMHGVKVRAVQHKRWTPDTSRSRSMNSMQPPPVSRSSNHVNTSSYNPPTNQQQSNADHSTLTKKSSIYERRDVVLMEVRNRGWSQGGQNSNYKQDPKRPWSSQSRRNNHHICSHCRGPIYQGPMMAIPDKDLYFHHKCLVCVVCRSSVSMNYGRATVFLRHSLPHCTSCYSNDNGIKVTTC